MRPRKAEIGPLQVTLDEADGSFERMLRKFVRKVRDEGVIDEVRGRARGYRKPSEARRVRKSAPR